MDLAAQAQLFLNAQAAAQLAVLPTFSNDPKEDKYTASQWLQKVLIHKAGARWDDQQMITHVRNAFRGSVIDWFDMLAPLGVNITIWAEIQAEFESVFEAAPSTSTVVHKIPEIKQAPGERIEAYMARSIKITEEFKAKIEVARFVVPALVLVDGQPGFAGQEAYATFTVAQRAVLDPYRVALDEHIKAEIASQTLKNVAAILITAGLKPDLKAEVLKRDLIEVREIFNVALKAERLNKEKFAQPLIKNGHSLVSSGSVSEVQSDHEVQAVGYRNSNSQNRSGRGGGGYQSQPHSSYSSNGDATYQSQRGGTQSGRGQNHPQRGGASSSSSSYPHSSSSSSTQQGSKKFCKFCHKPGHSTDDCFKLDNLNKAKAEKAGKKKVNQVDSEKESEENDNCFSVNAQAKN